MGIYELISWLFGMEEVKKEKLDKESYAYTEIDFEDENWQGNDIILNLPGKSCIKVEYTGDKQDATLKIGSKRASELPLNKIKSFKSIGGFDVIFLSSSDTNGKLVLVVSAGVISEIKPTITEEIGEAQTFSEVKYLAVNSSDGQASLAPSAGKQLLILGFNVCMAKGAPTGCDGAAYLYYGTYGTGYLWVMPNWDDGIGNNTNFCFSHSPIRKLLEKDVKITLRNHIWTGGTDTNVAAVIFYREV